MKTLWVSNAPWVGTGYGQQTDLVTRSLIADGHKVSVLANFGLNGTVLNWNGITVMPPGADPWGNDVVRGHASMFFGQDPGWIITLFDVWVAQGKAWGDFNVASWVPVDHIPAPPKVLKFFEDYKAIPIAMSKFGERQLQNAGLDPLYAPHGVDTTIFRPDAESINGYTMRQLFDLGDDRFVVGMNAANKGNIKIRKAFPQAFAAFGIFAKTHPDAVLLVHTERHGMYEGVRLDRLAEACGIPENQLIFTDQYSIRVGMQAETVAAIYNAFDVLLAPSMGEGFGVPVIEAQACGLPVIVSDFSAQPELVGAGWCVGGLPDWEEAQAAWLHLPNIGEIVDALEEAYNGNYDSEKARAKALEYDHKEVFSTYWRPIMERLSEYPDKKPHLHPAN